MVRKSYADICAEVGSDPATRYDFVWGDSFDKLVQEYNFEEPPSHMPYGPDGCNSDYDIAWIVADSIKSACWNMRAQTPARNHIRIDLHQTRAIAKSAFLLGRASRELGAQEIVPIIEAYVKSAAGLKVEVRIKSSEESDQHLLPSSAAGHAVRCIFREDISPLRSTVRRALNS